MKQAIDSGTIVTDSEFRKGVFGLQFWLEEECQNWDTNTGREDGKMYRRWRKATKRE